MRIVAAALALVLAAGACDGGEDSPRVSRRTPPKGAPNFLILLSDDQSTRLFNRTLMPRVFSDLVDRGINFTRAYANLPLCCPSRATILTGLRAEHTGVDTNSERLEGRERSRPTFVRALYEAGYRTMLAGKYLNSETCGPRDEWDRWACVKGGSHVDPTINEDGRPKEHEGYTTDLLADRVIDFIGDARAEGRPFFALYSPKSPHEPADDPRAQAMPVSINNPPSYDAQPDQASLPEWVRRAPMPADLHTIIRSLFERMTRQMPPLDAAIGRILDAVGPDAQNTFVLFMSDNGYLYGEHRLAGKSAIYEESIRLPFVVRYPALLPTDARFESAALVSNTDVAATIMEIAGIPWAADGRSMVPLIARRTTSIRDALPIEWCTANGQDCVDERENRAAPVYRGLHTGRHVYIEYETGEAELYDLATDPFELTNLAPRPSHAAIRRQLSMLVESIFQEPAQPETTIASGPQGPGARAPLAFEFFSPALKTGFRCKLEGPGRTSEDWERCDEGRVTYRSLAPGRYRFLVRAVDERSAEDPTPAERSFDVS